MLTKPAESRIRKPWENERVTEISGIRAVRDVRAFGLCDTWVTERHVTRRTRALNVQCQREQSTLVTGATVRPFLLDY